MTVTLAGNAGDLPAWESTRFLATVNGVSAMIYGITQEMHIDVDSPYLTQDTPSEQSILKFTYDEPVTIVVGDAPLEGLTTGNIYPVRDDVTFTVSGGVATITLPVDEDGIDLWVEFNGDRQNVLHIFAQPPLTEVDVNTATTWRGIGPSTVSGIDTGTNVITTGANHNRTVGQKVHYYTTGTYPTAVGGNLNSLDIYYVLTTPTSATMTLSRTAGGAVIDLTGAGTGTQTVSLAEWTDTGTPLLFDAGEHRIGMLFALADDVEIYLAHGAVVIGSLDVRESDRLYLHGPGVMSGSFATTQSGQPFDVLVPYSMIYGYNASKFYFDNQVEGITFLASPGFVNFYGVWSWRHVQHISPWEANTDGFSTLGRASDNIVGEKFRCYTYAGDDGIHLDNGTGYVLVNKCFAISSGNGSPYFLGYTYQGVPGSYVVEVTDCHAMTLAGADGGTFDWPFRGFSAIVKAWIDSPITENKAIPLGTYAVRGRHGVSFDGLDVWGPLDSRFASLQNLPYVFIGAGDGKGQVFDVSFRNVTVHETPGQLSIIEGFDWNDTPHDIPFYNVTFGGVLATVRNYSAYFAALGPYPFRISFGGRNVTTDVNVCNTALSYIGERDRVTAIDPPDGSEEARQCARAFPEAFEELVEMHTWSFATRKIQLTVVNEDSADTDDPAWAYRYELPEGMAEAISILPENHVEDYVIGAAKQPQNFHMKLSTTDGEERIYSNVPNAWLRYTVYVTDVNQCSRLFIACLTWLTASKLAGTIARGDTGEAMKMRCLQMFGKYLAEAKTRDSRQRQVSARTEPGWMAARTSQNPWMQPRSLLNE